MNLNQLKNHFVTWQNLMAKLGLSENAYIHWRKNGYVPYHQQLRIEKLTNGLLKADLNDKRGRGNGDKQRAKKASEANQRRAGTIK